MTKIRTYLSTFAVSTAAVDNWGFDKLTKCQGSQKEVARCDLDPCETETCIDCVWDDWSDWGPPLCLLALCERHREIYTHNNECGKPCEGPKTETKKCTPECKTPPKDCVLGEWTNWSECTSPCGGGERTRTRTVVSDLENGGSPCEGGLKEIEACNLEDCNDPVHCKLSDWGKWGACSVSCGGGEKKRKRTITQPARFGGETCDYSVLEEVASCNENGCDGGIDCIWSEWNDWSACSKSCDGGQKTRERHIDQAPRGSGKLCDPKTMSEVDKCNEQPCKSQQDCIFGEWSEWDACSCSCNGVQQRARHISVYPTNGGKPCDGGMKEVKGCNNSKDYAEKCGLEKPKATPVDCVLTEWSSWSACSASCGGGQMQMTRQIEQHPEHGGKACEEVYGSSLHGDGDGANLERIMGCNQDLCDVDQAPEETNVDCAWQDWEPWGTCSKTCGGGQRLRQRTIAQMANRVGQPCEHGSKLEVEECNTQACDSVDGVWAEWSEWSAPGCTGLCERHRGILQHYSGQGKPLEGPKVETKYCEPECELDALDCEVSEWGYWSDCSKSCDGGQQFRKKMIETQVVNGGRPCEATIKETRNCNTDIQCEETTPIDCVLSEWSYWSACSRTCGEGQKIRTRVIENHSHWLGTACGSMLDGGEGRLQMTETAGCNDGQCDDDIDCVWDEWSDWGACSQSCGNGFRGRDRGIKTAPRGSGKLCEPHERSEIQACKLQECGIECIDGRWSDWSYWSECSASCGGGYRYKYRKVEVSPSSCPECGKTLEGPDRAYESCNTQACDLHSVDCEFSEWSAWGDCSCPCNGIKDRSRRITTYPAKGGKPCDGPTKEVTGCNEKSIECTGIPVDCVFSEWGSWGECSSECGGGIQRRIRDIANYPLNGGAPCEGSLVQVDSCNEGACPGKVDCEWGEWAEWGACSKDCGGGTKTRFRHIITMPKNGGTSCGEQKDALQVESCNNLPCGQIQYCNWSEWGSWSECSATCGTAIMSRKRELVMSANKPYNESDILVTGILYDLEKLLGRPLSDNFLVGHSYSHLAVVFFAGMVMTLLSVSLGHRYYRSFRNSRLGREQQPYGDEPVDFRALQSGTSA